MTSPDVDVGNVEGVVARLSSQGAKLYLANTPDWVEVSRKILEQSAKQGIRWSHIGHSDYPALWNFLSERPVIFSYLGEPCWKKDKCLSVVGSRTPMPETARWMNRELGEFLTRHEVCVVSGGARGVDQRAHRLAMDTGRPTICILPSGLLNPYPPGNGDLWRAIQESGGCLMSTCRLDEPMHKGFFHRRNRWIAGLSRLCLVAEANRRSGSILTARLVGEEGRALCTVPLSPMSEQGLGAFHIWIEYDAAFVRDWLDLKVIWGMANEGEFWHPTAVES